MYKQMRVICISTNGFKQNRQQLDKCVKIGKSAAVKSTLIACTKVQVIENIETEELCPKLNRWT